MIRVHVHHENGSLILMDELSLSIHTVVAL